MFDDDRQQRWVEPTGGGHTPDDVQVFNLCDRRDEMSRDHEDTHVSIHPSVETGRCRQRIYGSKGVEGCCREEEKLRRVQKRKDRNGNEDGVTSLI